MGSGAGAGADQIQPANKVPGACAGLRCHVPVPLADQSQPANKMQGASPGLRCYVPVPMPFGVNRRIACRVPVPVPGFGAGARQSQSATEVRGSVPVPVFGAVCLGLQVPGAGAGL